MNNLIETNWRIITGAPCSGKTTTIKSLESLGYNVYPEASREILDNALKNGQTIEEITKVGERFEVEIWDLKKKFESNSDVNKTIFFDRSPIDSFAFWKSNGVDLHISNFNLTHRYKQVFFLEALPYVKDDLRIHSEEEGKVLSENILYFYKLHGYKPIIIPSLSVDERKELIINNIKNGV